MASQGSIASPQTSDHTLGRAPPASYLEMAHIVWTRPDEMGFDHNGRIKPRVTTAPPSKTHLAFNLDRGGGSFNVIGPRGMLEAGLASR